MTGPALVLIIEDNERNLKLARDILNHAGYETLEAENAEDGLELARARHPGLVLMDVQLPGMDGVQALVRLRADPATADIPVIALTANALPRDRAQAMADGFFDYLTKPIDVGRLLQAIDSALSSGHGAAPPR